MQNNADLYPEAGPEFFPAEHRDWILDVFQSLHPCSRNHPQNQQLFYDTWAKDLDRMLNLISSLVRHRCD